MIVQEDGILRHSALGKLKIMESVFEFLRTMWRRPTAVFEALSPLRSALAETVIRQRTRDICKMMVFSSRDTRL